ncbi:MAG: hypothetical protein ACLRMZ_20210 [Blautia marasmi]
MLPATAGWGEIGRLTKDYDSAMEYYRKSLDIHANIHNISGKTLLYLHMGNGLFDTGIDCMAERYIKAAIQSFEHLHVVYKRSTAYAYEAVLLFSAETLGICQGLKEPTQYKSGSAGTLWNAVCTAGSSA